jgi:cytochrome c peroxidase
MQHQTTTCRRQRATRNPLLIGLLISAGLGIAAMSITSADPDQPNNPQSYSNDSGRLQTYTTAGRFDTKNPFFLSLGTNGRSCVSCHQPGDAWSVSVKSLRKRFDQSNGLDPVFRTNDGSNSPLADVSTLAARRAAYSMLLSRGVFRVGIGIPENAEFELAAADDPYGYATATELSLFRRPLPATNLRFLSAVMWDGRETIQPINSPFDGGQGLLAGLRHQANDATLGHAQASSPLTEQQIDQIVQFETSTFTAQSNDNGAGLLTAQAGRGGPMNLAGQQFYIGINDVLGADPFGVAFDSSSMQLFAGWGHRDSHSNQAALARGETLFNTKRINIAGVKGLNDSLGIAVIPGTCTSCHDTPNVGNHSVPLAIDIGISAAARRTPDMPLYTLRHKSTGETVQVTDPGRALITGKWNDIAKFKGPVLRALSARPPFFHDGSAATLGDAVDFYDTRFGIGFTNQERSDLIAFLKAL